MVELNPTATLSLESAPSLKQAVVRLWQWAARPIVFLSLFLLLFGLSRWPAMRYNSELNTDESLWMSGAMRYEQDLVPWRSVNTNTSGPLNSLPFFLLRKVCPLSYSMMHTACFLLLALSVILLWRALWNLYTPKIAGLGAWVTGLYLILQPGRDLAHFSSEVIPTFLFSLALWCFTKGLRDKGAQTAWWSLAALLVGACPWAKLQSAPMSLCFFAGLCWMTLWPPGSRSARWPGFSRLIMMAAGFMATTCVFLAIIIAAGVWQDFWISYIARNLSYADGGGFLPWAHRVMALWQQVIHGDQISLLVVGLGILMSGWAWARFHGLRQGKPEHRAFLAFSFLYWLAALYAVTKPPFMFPHYFLLMVPPTGLLISALLGIWSDGGTELESPDTGRCSPKLLWCAFAAVALQFFGLRAFASPRVGQTEAEIGYESFRSSLVADIQKQAPNAHALGVWGWCPYLFVKTGLMPASRHTIGHFVISPNPLRDYYRRTYLEDIKRSRPEIFVDAVTPLSFMWFDWSEKDRIESFPELAKFIRENYHVAGLYPPDLRMSYRVFVLNGPQAAPPVKPGLESKP